MKNYNILTLVMILFMLNIPLYAQLKTTNETKTEIFKKLNLEKELKSTPNATLTAYKKSKSTFNDKGLETIKRRQFNNRRSNYPKTFLSLKLGIDDPWIGFTYERVIEQRLGLEFQIGILGAAIGGKLYAPTVEYNKINAYVGVLTGIGFGGQKTYFPIGFQVVSEKGFRFSIDGGPRIWHDSTDEGGVGASIKIGKGF